MRGTAPSVARLAAPLDPFSRLVGIRPQPRQFTKRIVLVPLVEFLAVVVFVVPEATP
jgi:hypothetical protein